MFKLLILLSIAAYCRSTAYPGLGVGNNYGLGIEQLNELLKRAKNYGTSSGSPAANIQAQRTVEIKPITSSHDTPHEQIIDVPPDETPFTIHFRTHSNRIVVQQSRTPGVASEVEHTSSEDEPQRVTHEVVRPVIQEVREVIQPYRRLVQQIQPVVEELHTVAAKGEPRSNRVSPRVSPRASTQTQSDPSINNLSQGSVLSYNGVPVYRSLYKGPAYTRESVA